MGYYNTGRFTVTGVDNEDQPNYPFTFAKADALEYLESHAKEYDFIHASPPCQRYTPAMRMRPGKFEEYPDLVDEVREALIATGKPYVIENVPESPLKTEVQLCGTMFAGLRVYRHRKFEATFAIAIPEHGWHTWRKWERESIAGRSRWKLEDGKRAMGVYWMKFKKEVVEAIPPAYTEYIGRQYLLGV